MKLHCWKCFCKRNWQENQCRPDAGKQRGGGSWNVVRNRHKVEKRAIDDVWNRAVAHLELKVRIPYVRKVWTRHFAVRCERQMTGQTEHASKVVKTSEIRCLDWAPSISDDDDDARKMITDRNLTYKALTRWGERWPGQKAAHTFCCSARS